MLYAYERSQGSYIPEENHILIAQCCSAIILHSQPQYTRIKAIQHFCNIVIIRFFASITIIMFLIQVFIVPTAIMLQQSDFL